MAAVWKKRKIGGKAFGGIYDNRLLVKPTKSAVALLSNAPGELPYEGAKDAFGGRREEQGAPEKLIEAL